MDGYPGSGSENSSQAVSVCGEAQREKSPTSEVRMVEKLHQQKPNQEEKVALGFKPLCVKLHPSTSPGLDFKAEFHRIDQAVLN